MMSTSRYEYEYDGSEVSGRSARCISLEKAWCWISWNEYSSDDQDVDSYRLVSLISMRATGAPSKEPLSSHLSKKAAYLENASSPSRNHLGKPGVRSPKSRRLA